MSPSVHRKGFFTIPPIADVDPEAVAARREAEAEIDALWSAYPAYRWSFNGTEPCRRDDADPEAWFTVEEPPKGTLQQRVPEEFQRRAAERLCTGCPLLVECRTYARTYRIEYGVWGGETALDRNTHHEQMASENTANQNKNQQRNR